jgi:DNA-binding NtrC family response regulator
MKPNVILLIDADVETCAAALTASQAAGFDVRFAKIQRDFSEIADLGLDDVAVTVLDYDPDVHGPAIVETLGRWLPSRPLIFVSSAEDMQHPMVVAGGMMKHVIKPVTAHRLAHAIKTATHDADCRCPSCDRWGHPYGPEGVISPRAEKAVA